MTHLRRREPRRRPSKPGAADFRLAIAQGNVAMGQLIAMRDNAKDDATRRAVNLAITKHEGFLASWRAKLAELLDARAAKTNGTRASRLAAAAEKRRRKADRRLSLTARIIQ